MRGFGLGGVFAGSGGVRGVLVGGDGEGWMGFRICKKDSGSLDIERIEMIEIIERRGFRG